MNFTKKNHLAILLIGILIVFIYFQNIDDKDNVEIENDHSIINNGDNEKLENEKTDKTEKQDKNIIVDIKGAILNPGIIEIESESRVADVVNLAGGFLENADIKVVNLAKIVEDEEMIYIPFINESTNQNIEDSLEENFNKKENEKININKAEKEELKKLDGIGDSTAEKIMDYRKENKFEKIEDVMNVSGIGEKKFESIKDSIEVK